MKHLLCCVYCFRGQRFKVWPIYINSVFQVIYTEFGESLKHPACYLSFYTAMHRHFSGSPNKQELIQRGLLEQATEKRKPFRIAGERMQTGVACWHVHSVVSDSCDPMDCTPPGSSVHGILQARILE